MDVVYEIVVDFLVSASRRALSPSTAAADKLSIHQDLGSRCSRPGLVFLPLHSAGQIRSLRLGVSVLQTSLCAPPCTHMSTCLFKQPTPGTSSETVVAVAKKKKKKKKELLASMTRTYWMWYTRSWWIFVSAKQRALCNSQWVPASHGLAANNDLCSLPGCAT